MDKRTEVISEEQKSILMSREEMRSICFRAVEMNDSCGEYRLYCELCPFDIPSARKGTPV